MDKNTRIYVAGHHGLMDSTIRDNLQHRGYMNPVEHSHRKLDLLDGIAVKQFFDEEQPDTVVLVAARVGDILTSLQCRANFIHQNFQVWQNAISENFRHDVQKLLFLGSIYIYPRDAAQPIKEDALLASPLEYTSEPYAIARIAGLRMCESFSLQCSTNYIVVTPTNLYDPNDNLHLENSHVLPAMIRKTHLAKCSNKDDWKAARRDLDLRPMEGVAGSESDAEILDKLAKFGITPESITFWGTGALMCEFLWSREMADASVHILLNIDFKDTYVIGSRDTHNCHIDVGTGEEVSIHEAAEIIIKGVDFKGILLWDSPKPSGTMRKLTDVSKLHSLGWYREVEIDEGTERPCKQYLKGI